MDAPLRRIELVSGNIVTLKVDAVVNAANTTLLGGGGVDGAIHRAAGPALQEECRALGGCHTGEARLTRGHRLAAGHIIHTVGPVYRDGTHGEPEKLAGCYAHSLAIAAREKFGAVAFPAISCGAYRYPLAEAADIAVRAVIGFLAQNDYPRRVLFCCREEEVYTAYERRLAEAGLA
jgi:O-acetyl-ADP-ribose deacetylase (regulator of RNase III)